MSTSSARAVPHHLAQEEGQRRDADTTERRVGREREGHPARLPFIRSTGRRMSLLCGLAALCVRARGCVCVCVCVCVPLFVCDM